MRIHFDLSVEEPIIYSSSYNKLRQYTAVYSRFWRFQTVKCAKEKAWHYGDNWQTEIQKEHHVNVRRAELTAELDKIYRGIRGIDRKEYSGYGWENEYGFNYKTWSGWGGMYRWWCDVAKKHPLGSVQYGELRWNKEGLPQIEVTTALKGGITFSKVFVFEYLPLEERWQALYGLDFHLDEKWRDFPKIGKIPLP